MVTANIIQAVNMALEQEMKLNDKVLVLGEDVGLNGGVFRATDGLQKKFGQDRVIDTPLSEPGIISAGIGLAVNGMLPVAEIQFSGFLLAPLDQLYSHASRIRMRSRGRFTCPLVVRAPYGGGIHALELHCESNEAMFAQTPGLKMVIPSTPYDTKGLLAAAIRDPAIRDPDPVIFYEPMRIYRAIKQDIPEEEYIIPIGKANVIQQGDDLTLIGACKLKRAFSFIVAMISAAKPAVLIASCTITALPVFLIEFIIVSESKGLIVLKSIISTLYLLLSFSTASFEVLSIEPHAIKVRSSPCCITFAFPMGIMYSSSGMSCLIAL